MKKKNLMLAVAACLIVLSIAGSSLAYFTDTDAATNVFTSGDGVDIELDYTHVSEKRYPGKTYNDVAKITLAQNSEKAYVGAIITLTKEKLADIMTESGTGDIPATISNIFVGLNANTVKYDEETAGVCTIYVIVEDELTQQTPSATIFDKIQIPAKWDRDQMKVFNDMEIKIKAYAVQTVGFEDVAALTALKAAFSDWDSCPA